MRPQNVNDKPPPSNFEISVKEEMKKVIRCFQRHTSQERADLSASHRLTQNQRNSVGHHYYVHPDLPDTAFPTRKRAAVAALTHGDVQ
jgi:hypothetical protein